jgi:hypothetical protein
MSRCVVLTWGTETVSLRERLGELGVGALLHRVGAPLGRDCLAGTSPATALLLAMTRGLAMTRELTMTLGVAAGQER